MVSSERYYGMTLNNDAVFTQMPRKYDAYDKDIAVLEIYFKKSTVVQIGSQARMTWYIFYFEYLAKQD